MPEPAPSRRAVPPGTPAATAFATVPSATVPSVAVPFATVPFATVPSATVPLLTGRGVQHGESV
ncbi:hypothetical protein [Streptomyces sp. NPDC020996]|uniref:hypothetical protein n=1 Tax=Streptomyces sp. NPDC020996 TaxID=3154791 RepID=UPI0033D39E37